MASNGWVCKLQGGYTSFLEFSRSNSENSVSLNHNGSGTEGAMLYSAYDRGGLFKTPEGCIQTVVHVKNVEQDGSSEQYVGLFCMVDSISDLLNTSSMYSFMIGIRKPGIVSLNLGKSIKSGVNGLSPSGLNRVIIDPPIPLGSYIALQFDWLNDRFLYPGTKIIARWKHGADFNNLTEVFNRIDIEDMLDISMTKGLGSISSSIDVPNIWSVSFHHTSIFDKSF